MNTRTLSLILLACIGLCACKKTEEAMAFGVAGIEDIDIRYTEIRPIPLQLSYISGPHQTVNLSVEGLPQGALITFIPNISIPPFDTKMNLSTKNVKGGEYPLKITAGTKNSTPQVYNIKMRVRGVEEIGCALELLGDYTGPVSAEYNMDMRKPFLRPGAQKNTIEFTNCEPLGFYANLDCDKTTLEIPKQKTPAGHYVWGSGTYNGMLISMSMQLEDTLGNIIKRRAFNLEKAIIVY